MSKKKKCLEALLNADVTVGYRELAYALYQHLDTPVSLGCYLRLKYNEDAQLCQMSVNSADYHWHADVPQGISFLKPRMSQQVLDDRYSFGPNLYEYMLNRQAVDFLRKYPELNTGINTAEVAESTFIACEAACKHTNNRLRKTSDNWSKSFTATVLGAQRIISRVLGDMRVDEWLDACRLGPGTVIGTDGTSDVRKLSQSISVTQEFEPYALRFLEEFQGWINALSYGGEASFDIDVYVGGRFSTVPKDAKTDRCIEVQPMLNAFAQTGIGTMMRRRLANVGIDLNDQTKNQRAAIAGSCIGGDLCTIDLSNASDMISSEVVKLLLPEDWYHACDLVRTRSIMFKGKRVELERFSSMGNGFTFELESLIFYAISRASQESPYALHPIRDKSYCSVYGDDIVVRQKGFITVVEALTEFGFVVNNKKSFSVGPFRESCGVDALLGRNVRPFFLKEPIENVARIISVANGLRRAACRVNRDRSLCFKFKPAYIHLLRRIPANLRKNIAFGNTGGDDYIFQSNWRPGYALKYIPRLIRVEKYYPAVGAALYRAYIKGDSDRTLAYLNPVITGDQRGEIHDYRRDDGSWGLRKILDWQVEQPTQYLAWV